MNDWIYELNERVVIAESMEKGIVIGRAEYVHSERHYLIRYKAADGRAVEAWWGASALNSLPPEGEEA